MKKQVPQVSYKTVVGDLISFHSFGSVVNLFRSDMILFCSYFKFQELSVMLVAALTNSSVKNQVPQFLFKTIAGDLVLVSSHKVADILLCDSLYILEAILVIWISSIRSQQSQCFSTIDHMLISSHN